MPRITEIFLIEAPEQHALAIRATAAVAELPGIIDEAIDQLEEHFKRTLLSREFGHNRG